MTGLVESAASHRIRWGLALLVALVLPITLLAQVTVGAIPDAAQATQNTDLFSTLPANGLMALIVVPVLQWLRNKEGVKWVNDRSVFWIAGATSAMTALGIHGAISPTGFHMDGTWKDLGDGAFDVVKQWSAFHWGHRGQQVAELLPKFMKAMIEANTAANKPDSGGGQ